MGFVSICPTPAHKMMAMKNMTTTRTAFRPELCIASFGGAELVDIHGEVYLRGGSSVERTEALEWISLCMPDRSVRTRPMRFRGFRPWRFRACLQHVV